MLHARDHALVGLPLQHRVRNLSVMDLKPVKSSGIAAVGYEPNTKTLGVKFRSGDLYHYHDVSAQAHQDLIGAKSIGQHFAAKVTNKYRFTKQPPQK